MVRGEQVALDLEHVLRVAQVAHKIARDRRDRLDATGVDLFPGAQDRIGVIPAE